MSNLIFAINLTIDGCCDHTKSTPTEELYDFFTHMMRNAETLVYGRKTYELMVPYWHDIAKNNAGNTKGANDFAKAFVSVNRIMVFSRSLDRAEGNNTRIVHANLQEEILKLKQEPGKNILAGGVDLPSQLMEMGLVDEFYFVVHPVIAGDGRRLLEGVNLKESLNLKLVDKKVFKSGCVALHYVRA